MTIFLGGITGTAGVVTFNGRTGNVVLAASDVTQALSGSPLSITSGGTGANTSTQALKNLLPGLTGNSGKVLGTDGINVTWVSGGGGSGISAGSSSTGFINYNGLTPAPAQWYGGGINPTDTTRLNFNGRLVATEVASTNGTMGSLTVLGDVGGTIQAKDSANVNFSQLTVTGDPIEFITVRIGGTTDVLATLDDTKMSLSGDLDVSGSLMFMADPGTSGQILASNGPGAAPSWISSSGGSLGNGVTAGSTIAGGYVTYSGTTSTAGQWNGGTTAPTSGTRLNYNGQLMATEFVSTNGTFGSFAVSGMNGGQLHSRLLDNSDYAFLAINGSVVSLGTRRPPVGQNPPQAVELLRLEETVATVQGDLRVGRFEPSINARVGIIRADGHGSFESYETGTSTYRFTTVAGDGINLSTTRGTDKANAVPLILLSESSAVVNGNLTVNNAIYAGGTPGTNGQVLTSTGSGIQWATVSGGGGTGLTSGSTSTGFVTYSGTTSTAGQWNGGTTAPTSTTRLNYNGSLFSTALTVGNGTSGTISVQGSSGGTVHSRNSGDTDYGFLAVNGSIVSLATRRSANSVTELLRLENDVATVQSNFVLNGGFGAGGSYGALGQVLTSTGTGVQWTTPSSGGGTGLTSGSTSTGYVTYSGTTSTAGQWNGGTTSPTATTRINYNGVLVATELLSTNGTSGSVTMSGTNGGTLHARNTSNTDYTFLAVNGSVVSLATRRSTNSATELLRLENNVATVQGNLVMNGGIAAGGSYGSSGQVLTSTGGGLQWTTPSSGGGSGTVTSVSANSTGWLTASVSNATTTPSITYSHNTSGVSANTYGNRATIPVMTVDSAGHITSATSATVSGQGTFRVYSNTTGGTNLTGGGLEFVDFSGTNFSRGYLTASEWHFSVNNPPGNDSLVIDNNNLVLIGYGGSQNNAYKLQVNSQIFATSATIATSDARYKTNVTPITGALGLVNSLNPVSFEWKAHEVHNFPAGKTVGFLAQEVQETLDGRDYAGAVVKSNECRLPDGTTEEFLGLAEGSLVSILTAAIKELSAKVTELENRLNGVA